MSEHDWVAARDALLDLGASVSARRELLGLSLRSVSSATGIGFTTIGRIERGLAFDARSADVLMGWLTQDAPAGCERPPPGWWCSRAKNHQGPCAARKGVRP